MQSIIEKYFLEHGQLVLPGIGYLNLHQTDAIHENKILYPPNKILYPPIEKIEFDLNVAPSTQPSQLFYIFLSDYLDCTIEEAIIDYAAFFTNQLALSNQIDLGNLGQLHILNEAYTFESNHNSSNYFKPIHFDKVQIEDQTENNFNTKSKYWWIIPLIIATCAVLAILLKL
jgi:hypothetical protein